ncbi:hypothetical protein D7147_15390 [Micromonospora musae]|uniref:Uncharacterized protein n=1 Tax=Micromonospora musae TaxID=1894970 RepID=A0A3A9YBI9_9ACTN|nr:hypothetical protein [Micromonospora musae]RKN18807.1 hypothetical protein D7147_15390 [Micromonospora musae]RKN34619.1 hypothetical protein D7044_07280 [Micromonospora musae]
MRAGDLLRQIDQRLLPLLSQAVARLGETSARSRVLAGTALLSVTAVLLTAVWAADDRPVGDPTVGEVTRVGVVDGDSVPGYLRAAAADLATLAEPAATPADGTYALVSLDSYLAPQGLDAVLGDVSVAAVFGRVPLPGRQTEIVRIPAQRVPEDVIAAMAEVAARKDREAADYRARVAATTGDAELRQLYASGAEVADAEAAAYRAGCACVYAAVVRAQPATLRAVASRRAVRAVDPAPEVHRLDRTVFTPPLPEQRDVVRPPADAALPEATPSPSASSPTASPSPTAVESSEPAPTVTESSPTPEQETPSAPPPTVTTSPDASGGRPVQPTQS